MSLKIENLTFSYSNATNIFENLSINFDKAGLYFILGPNGTGKTTLFKLILLALKADQGKIIIKGKENHLYGINNLAQELAYVPQHHNYVFNYKVMDLLLMAYTAKLGFFGRPSKAQKFEAYQILQKFSIEHLADKYFSKLSGGEQQLVLISRSLLQKTKIILMDEVSSHLDLGNQIRLLNIVKSLAEEGYIILMTSHNPQMACNYADELILFFEKKLLFKGPLYLKSRSKEENKIRLKEISVYLSQIYSCQLELISLDDREYHIRIL